MSRAGEFGPWCSSDQISGLAALFQPTDRQWLQRAPAPVGRTRRRHITDHPHKQVFLSAVQSGRRAPSVAAGGPRDEQTAAARRPMRQLAGIRGAARPQRRHGTGVGNLGQSWHAPRCLRDRNQGITAEMRHNGAPGLRIIVGISEILPRNAVVCRGRGLLPVGEFMHGQRRCGH